MRVSLKIRIMSPAFLISGGRSVLSGHMIFLGAFINTAKEIYQKIQEGVFDINNESFTSWLLPAQVSQRFYKEMTNIQKSLGQDIPEDHVSIDAYIVTMSHMFKKGRDQKAHIFYLVASDSNTVNSSDVATLCSLFLNAYTIALESTSVGAKWKLKSTPQDSERFVQMAMKELLGSKKQPCELTTEDLIAWFSRFPLIEHLFSAIIRACFIDLESIVEEHPHGLSEGCEETIGHIQYDRCVILKKVNERSLGEALLWLGKGIRSHLFWEGIKELFVFPGGRH
ncbi:predicted protein [Nematostella vectensis]|uniref:Uncharacterized protein n=1 Tax=Nematostella vectensis TaxID=45351 RepID=A7T9L5_NEMVE|nr:predicted protein [Nematostella vectensis]|eukprot:XP_001619409.1 hypothetical protein NEMVEDRAFT_v1g224210 [Nematostella vectensis]